MVLRGQKSTFKKGISKEKIHRLTSEMAASSSPSQRSSSHRTQPLPHSKITQASKGESVCDQNVSQITTQPDMFKQFEYMLQKALKQTSDHITDMLTREIRELGQRTADLELRMDEIDTRTHNSMTEIMSLKEENLTLQSRLEDQENRNRRSNLRIRGIPESYLDLQTTVTALFQELIPEIPIDRLEFDRVHRALAPRKSNGPPRDIITKLHYYRTKEQLLTAARGKDLLSFQGHSYQLFTDLSPLTVAKRRALKPQLQILQRNQIAYQWGFPFSLRFTHLETKYVCRSSEDLQSILIDIGLAEETLTKNQPSRSFISRSSQQNKATGSSSASSSYQNLSKRGRYEHSPPTIVDSMD